MSLIMTSVTNTLALYKLRICCDMEFGQHVIKIDSLSWGQWDLRCHQKYGYGTCWDDMLLNCRQHFQLTGRHPWSMTWKIWQTWSYQIPGKHEETRGKKQKKINASVSAHFLSTNIPVRAMLNCNFLHRHVLILIALDSDKVQDSHTDCNMILQWWLYAMLVF